MSTTKAMLVMIVTPRHLAIETRGDEDHDADEDGATAVSSVVMEQKKKTLKVMARLSEGIMQQERRTNETGVGEEIKSRHQAADQKEPSTLPPPTSGSINTASSSLDASKNGEDKSSDSLKTLGDSMTVGTTLRKSSQNSGEHDEPSPEEAAAVTKVVQAKHDFLFDDVIDNTVPDQQEVNVEELLRITLRRLLEEWHLPDSPIVYWHSTIPTQHECRQQVERQLVGSSAVHGTTDLSCRGTGSLRTHWDRHQRWCRLCTQG
jgi:hypothetical protein